MLRWNSATEPNSLCAIQDNGYPCRGLLFVGKENMTMEKVHSLVNHVVDFLNRYQWDSVARTVKMGHSSTNRYTLMSQPDLTSTPERRRLGDVVELRDAIGFIKENLDERVFDNHAYIHEPKAMKEFFDEPYNADLADAFSFPYTSDI